MASTQLGGNVVTLVGDLPQLGASAPDFTLVDPSLKEFSRDSTKRTVLNIFPSVDTGVCAASVREFNERAADLEGVDVINVSVDLPFAMSRFCGAEGIENARVGSAFRSSFGTDYGITVADGGFAGLLGRAVVVLDTDGTVLHSQLVPEIGQEPDYDSALSALG